MAPDDIRALRRQHGLTRAALAKQLGVAAEDVAAWETGERFTTKKIAARLAELRDSGPASPGAARTDGPWERLADPAVWALVRKLLAHPELLTRAQAIAASYPDPRDPA